MSFHQPKILPEDLLTIICDHYADSRQLQALSVISLLNRRISTYARTRLYRHFEFIDDRSSRVLDHANTLCAVYEDGELLDEDILSVVDSHEVDSLDLDPELRWLKGMRTCETIEIKDLLYGRDIESLITLGTSLSERGLVLFSKVNKVVIGGKLVKRILATESKGPRPKATPLDSIIAIFHTTRPRVLCIQNSAIFTPPPGNARRMISQPQSMWGRMIPARWGHMSNTTIQFIEGMEQLEEIRYYDVDVNIPIYPKKGVRHIVHFLPDPNTKPGTSTSVMGDYKEKLIREIKDVISKSVVKIPVRSANSTIPKGGGGRGSGGGSGGLFGGPLPGGAGTAGIRFFGVPPSGEAGGGHFNAPMNGVNGGGRGGGSNRPFSLFGHGTTGPLFGNTAIHPNSTPNSEPIVARQPNMESSNPMSVVGPNGVITITHSGPSTANANPVSSTKTGPSNISGRSNTATRPTGSEHHIPIDDVSDDDDDDDDEEDQEDEGDRGEPPAYAPPITSTRPTTVLPRYTPIEVHKQSSWLFILPFTSEIETIEKVIMNWTERYEGELRDEVRAGISLRLSEE